MDVVTHWIDDFKNNPEKAELTIESMVKGSRQDFDLRAILVPMALHILESDGVSDPDEQKALIKLKMWIN